MLAFFHPILAGARWFPVCIPRGKGPLGGIFHEQMLFHPLVVHFPVALWLTSALSDLLHVIRPNSFHPRTAQYLIGLGLVAAVVSIDLGFCDAIPLAREGVGQTFIERHAAHQTWALAATGFYALSFIVRWRRPEIGRAATVVLMAIGAILISVTGYLGGEIRLVM
jgi:uncharacterized membrane protein